jgi:hypothetical protein
LKNALESLLKAWARDIFVAVLGRLYDNHLENPGIFAGELMVRRHTDSRRPGEKKSRNGDAARP